MYSSQAAAVIAQAVAGMLVLLVAVYAGSGVANVVIDETVARLMRKIEAAGAFLQPPDLMSASCCCSMQCRETVADMLLLW